MRDAIVAHLSSPQVLTDILRRGRDGSVRDVAKIIEDWDDFDSRRFNCILPTYPDRPVETLLRLIFNPSAAAAAINSIAQELPSHKEQYAAVLYLADSMAAAKRPDVAHALLSLLLCKCGSKSALGLLTTTTLRISALMVRQVVAQQCPPMFAQQQLLLGLLQTVAAQERLATFSSACQRGGPPLLPLLPALEEARAAAVRAMIRTAPAWDVDVPQEVLADLHHQLRTIPEARAEFVNTVTKAVHDILVWGSLPHCGFEVSQQLYEMEYERLRDRESEAYSKLSFNDKERWHAALAAEITMAMMGVTKQLSVKLTGDETLYAAVRRDVAAQLVQEISESSAEEGTKAVAEYAPALCVLLGIDDDGSDVSNLIQSVPVFSALADLRQRRRLEEMAWDPDLVNLSAGITAAAYPRFDFGFGTVVPRGILECLLEEVVCRDNVLEVGRLLAHYGCICDPAGAVKRGLIDVAKGDESSYGALQWLLLAARWRPADLLDLCKLAVEFHNWGRLEVLLRSASWATTVSPHCFLMAFSTLVVARGGSRGAEEVLRKFHLSTLKDAPAASMQTVASILRRFICASDVVQWDDYPDGVKVAEDAWLLQQLSQSTFLPLAKVFRAKKMCMRLFKLAFDKDRIYALHALLRTAMGCGSSAARHAETFLRTLVGTTCGWLEDDGNQELYDDFDAWIALEFVLLCCKLGHRIV